MQKCALVIGHKKASPGAINVASGLTEFAFNEKLAMDIEQVTRGVEVQRIYRRTYSTLPADINDYRPDFIISLHCNAFNKTASGTEVLYYHRSQKSQALAELLQAELIRALGLKDRGTKPRSSEDRGGHLLKNTAAPCVISEPFFIDNDQDLAIVESNYEALVSAYANTIERAGGVQITEDVEIPSLPRPMFTLSNAIAMPGGKASGLDEVFGFYSEVLGLPKHESIDGAIQSGPFEIFLDGNNFSEGVMLELKCEDVERAKDYLLANGCEVVHWDGAGAACIIRDPFGVCFNIWQDETN